VDAGKAGVFHSGCRPSIPAILENYLFICSARHCSLPRGSCAFTDDCANENRHENTHWTRTRSLFHRKLPPIGIDKQQARATSALCNVRTYYLVLYFKPRNHSTPTNPFTTVITIPRTIPTIFCYNAPPFAASADTWRGVTSSYNADWRNPFPFVFHEKIYKRNAVWHAAHEKLIIVARASPSPSRSDGRRRRRLACCLLDWLSRCTSKYTMHLSSFLPSLLAETVMLFSRITLNKASVNSETRRGDKIKECIMRGRCISIP